MKSFYVSFIHIEGDKPVSVALSESIIGYENALKEIEWQRQNRKVISAWIDTFEDNNNKSTVFHECYIDCFGNIDKKR